MLLSNNGGSSKTYIDDYFSVQLRAGNGTSQSVTTGFQPDLVWTKSRSATTGHRLVDSARGVGNSIESNSPLAQQSEAAGITALNSSVYSVGADSDYNTNAATYVDCVWKKAPKFFDVVTYTGDGVAGRQVAHNLGIAPGMVVVKRTDSNGDWLVWHRSETGKFAYLNSTQAFQSDGGLIWGDGSVHIAPTDSNFTVNNYPAFPLANLNAIGGTYVAYLFAHDAAENGLIQCGTYTVGVGNIATISLGFEPQFLLLKRSDSSSDWYIVDTMRGMTAGSNALTLSPSNASAETTAWGVIQPTPTGFIHSNIAAATSHIYIAIRRQNKPPTTGTGVHSTFLYTGDGVSSRVLTPASFPADLFIYRSRGDNPASYSFSDRLRGNTRLASNVTSAEISTVNEGINFTGDSQNQIKLGANDGASGGFNNTIIGNYVMSSFRRAPGFFDVVCYTGTGVARTVPHNLGVAPELMIVKRRDTSVQWMAYSQATGGTHFMSLNLNNAAAADSWPWNNTAPTSSVLTVGISSATNGSSGTHVAYLFASLPGVSSCFSYTGNGTSQNINCGFASGSRFVLIKRTDSTGDWYIWDSARGIISGNDPHLSLNTTAAEVTTDDSIDPIPEGFAVNQNTATNVNVLNATYIGLAIA